MIPIRGCIRTLEKLSLVTCSNEVLIPLERSVKNVQPIFSVDTTSREPLIWLDELKTDRLHPDEIRINLSVETLKSNAPKFVEDYVVLGHLSQDLSESK